MAGSQPDQPSRFTRRNFLIGTGAIAAGMTFYAGEIARHEIDVVHRPIPIANLPSPFHGYRIVQLSDIHLDEYTEPYFLEHIVSMVNALAPDLVLLTGDFVTHGSLTFIAGNHAAHRCAEIIATLTAPLRYAILGNHDVAVFGPVISAVAVPSAAYSSSHNTIEITPSTDLYALLASAPSTYKYVLNTQAGLGPAEVVAEKAYVQANNIKSVALLDAQDDTGKIQLTLDTQAFTQFGVKIVYSATFPDATTDFAPYVAKITAAHPDLLLLPYADTWEVPILTLARQQNSAKFVRGNDLFPALNSGATPATNFFFDTALPSQFNPSPAMQSFINAYQSFTGTTVTPTTYFSYVFSSYPEVYLLVKAMQEAGSVTDEAAILSHMRGATMTTPGGFVPTMTFNAQGQISSYDEQCTIVTGGVAGMKCQGYSAGAGS